MSKVNNTSKIPYTYVASGVSRIEESAETADRSWEDDTARRVAEEIGIERTQEKTDDEKDADKQMAAYEKLSKPKTKSFDKDLAALKARQFFIK